MHNQFILIENVKDFVNKNVIYCLESPSGKFYIGQTIEINVRFNKYQSASCTGQPKIYSSLNKYEFVNFNKYIIAITDKQEDLNDLEIFWISWFKDTFGEDNILNCTDGGMGKIGYKSSDETKRKISEAGKGRIHSDETKKNISDLLQGHKVSDETKAKLRDANLGKKYSEERLEKAKEKYTDEVRKKMSESALKREKRTMSEESKKKISASHMGIKQTKEYNKKHVETLREKLKKENKFLGINKLKNNTYKARINFGGKRLDLGNYKTEEDAAKVYDIKSIELNGVEFAVTNFPIENYI